jgi:hypothetical protein
MPVYGIRNGLLDGKTRLLGDAERVRASRLHAFQGMA